MKNENVIKVVAAIGFITMVFVNYLANALPIGGITTAEASGALPNLFTPAGITFPFGDLSIYCSLATPSINLKLQKTKKQAASFAKIRKVYILTSLANVCWILAWHYQIHLAFSINHADLPHFSHEHSQHHEQPEIFAQR
ncbi:MAG: hypothetical protein R3B71_04890 [Candidatus Gracilibacteria bacterium]